jgi:hypothetical protein
MVAPGTKAGIATFARISSVDHGGKVNRWANNVSAGGKKTTAKTPTVPSQRGTGRLNFSHNGSMA